MTAIALTIAGSDSGGGAGIQADLKTFSALHVYGASVITALTAQNTVRVEAVHVVPPDFVLAQMRAVASDLEVDAIKIGMLATGPVIEAVAEGLKDYPGVPVVLDPVMIAASGDPLLDPRLAQVASERPHQSLAQQVVQNGVRLADQPLERTGEPRELRDASRGEQSNHMPPHGIEEGAVVGPVTPAERPPVRVP